MKENFTTVLFYVIFFFKKRYFYKRLFFDLQEKKIFYKIITSYIKEIFLP